MLGRPLRRRRYRRGRLLHSRPRRIPHHRWQQHKLRLRVAIHMKRPHTTLPQLLHPPLLVPTRRQPEHVRGRSGRVTQDHVLLQPVRQHHILDVHRRQHLLEGDRVLRRPRRHLPRRCPFQREIHAAATRHKRHQPLTRRRALRQLHAEAVRPRSRLETHTLLRRQGNVGLDLPPHLVGPVEPMQRLPGNLRHKRPVGLLQRLRARIPQPRHLTRHPQPRPRPLLRTRPRCQHHRTHHQGRGHADKIGQINRAPRANCQGRSVREPKTSSE